eukprot:Em0002g1214a
MYRSSTAPSLIRLKDNLHTDSSPMVTGYICLERCLELYPNIPLSTRISILLDVSSELAHLHSQNPPITVGNITKCVMLTSGLKATLVEDASGEKNRLSDSQGFERHTHVHDIYQFGLLILKVVGKDTLSGADNKIQHEKGLERHCMHLSNLAMSCLQPDPLVRPSADTLRSTLQQLNASFCDCAKERTESKQMNTKLIDHSKFSAELEEENSYLRARCQDLEAENERLRKMCDELICAQRDQKPNRIQNKEKESSWLPSFIKRSRRSEPNISQARKHSGTVQLAAATSVVRTEPEGDNASSKGLLEQGLSRPHTNLFTVGECGLSQRPLPALPSSDDSTTGLLDDKAQSYEIPTAALCLETQQWFQAGVTVEEAQIRLKAIKIDGGYLVRESSTAKGQYTLSIYQSGHVRHIRIQNINSKHYTVDHRIIFETISELIKHYNTHPITLKDGFESMLLHECSNRKRSH